MEACQKLLLIISRRDAFHDFSEGEMNFVHIFKFNKGTNI